MPRHITSGIAIMYTPGDPGLLPDLTGSQKRYYKYEHGNENSFEQVRGHSDVPTGISIPAPVIATGNDSPTENMDITHGRAIISRPTCDRELAPKAPDTYNPWKPKGRRK